MFQDCKLGNQKKCPFRSKDHCGLGEKTKFGIVNEIRKMSKCPKKEGKK